MAYAEELPKPVAAYRALDDSWLALFEEPVAAHRVERSDSGSSAFDHNVVPAPTPVTTAPPRPDLALVTVNKHETKAVHDAFFEATGAQAVRVSLEGRVYHNLGSINGKTVYHTLSEMGSGNLGAMQQTVDKAIMALDPAAVIAVGIAFGVNRNKQAIGDVLVSRLTAV
jgi:hypothetical protein